MMTDSVSIKTWHSSGDGLMVNTYALGYNHPMHPYNQVIAQGKRPEDYGIKNPLEEEFASKSRNQLIEEIIALRSEINGRAMYGYENALLHGKRYD